MVVLPLRLLFFNSHLHPAATAVAAWQARVMTGGAAQGLPRSRRRSRHSRSRSSSNISVATMVILCCVTDARPPP
jgi:hypothetical protein